MSGSNQFLESLAAAVENDKPTEEELKNASAVGDPNLPSEKKAEDPDGNPPSPGDPGENPVGKDDPDRKAEETPAEKEAGADNPGDVPSPGDEKGNPNPTDAPSAATEGDETKPTGAEVTDTTSGIKSEANTHVDPKGPETEQEKDAQDPSGNTGDPADNNQIPVTPPGDAKPAELDQNVKDSYDVSGNTGDPADNNQTPVSPSGDSKEAPKNADEKKADDPDGNPPAPGDDSAETAPSFDSFIAACESSMTSAAHTGNTDIRIPESMSLESYAMELGLGVIAARAVEADLTAAERRALADSDFGLPEERKWPLNDESHVRSAIQHFHWCPKDQQRELAKNILKAMRRFNMNDVEVSEGNPFYEYYPEAKLVPRKKPGKPAN